jgi:hypothetical protein
MNPTIPRSRRRPAQAAAMHIAVLQAAFLAILPRIVKHARFHFRDLRCRHRQDDAVAETVALAWKWFLRLTRRGKDASRFPVAFANYAARAAKNGRRLCGQEKARDALSPLAQQHRGFAVQSLPMASSMTGNVFDEALADNTQTPVPDQVGFRLDFPAWRLGRCKRDRRLIDELMVGERTLDVARRYGLTPARISQLRRVFHHDWRAFCGELPEPSPVTATTRLAPHTNRSRPRA